MNSKRPTRGEMKFIAFGTVALFCSPLIGRVAIDTSKITIMPDICFNTRNLGFSGNRYVATYGLNSGLRGYPFSIRLPNVKGQFQDCSINFGLGLERPIRNKSSWKISARYRGYQFLLIPSAEYKRSRDESYHIAVVPYFSFTYFKINEVLLGLKHCFIMNRHQFKPFVRGELGYARSKNWDFFLDLDSRYDVFPILDVERKNFIPSFAFSTGIEWQYLSLRAEYHLLTKFNNTTSISGFNVGFSGHIPIY